MNPETKPPLRIRGILSKLSSSFLARAGLILLVYLVLHAAGFREYTGVLSGTLSQEGISVERAILFAIIYLAVYMAAVLLAPILAIAAMIRYLTMRLFTS